MMYLSLLLLHNEVHCVNMKLRKLYGRLLTYFFSRDFGSATTATARVALVPMGLTDWLIWYKKCNTGRHQKVEVLVYLAQRSPAEAPVAQFVLLGRTAQGAAKRS